MNTTGHVFDERWDEYESMLYQRSKQIKQTMDLTAALRQRLAYLRKLDDAHLGTLCMQDLQDPRVEWWMKSRPGGESLSLREVSQVPFYERWVYIADQLTNPRHYRAVLYSSEPIFNIDDFTNHFEDRLHNRTMTGHEYAYFAYTPIAQIVTDIITLRDKAIIAANKKRQGCHIRTVSYDDIYADLLSNLP